MGFSVQCCGSRGVIQKTEDLSIIIILHMDTKAQKIPYDQDTVNLTL